MPIANFFVPKLLEAFRALNQYNEDELDKIRYSL